MKKNYNKQIKETIKRNWDSLAEQWIHDSEAGHDIHRDFLNTPAFIKFLPKGIKGKKAIDIACGEGSNTRLLAKLGCKVTGVDFCEKFIDFAQEKEKKTNLGIKYYLANVENLPFKDNFYDFATSFMAMIDVSNPKKVLKEVYRILKPKGFFQFSIIHPCFTPPHAKHIRKGKRKTIAREVGKYYQTGKCENIFYTRGNEIKKSIRFHWTLSEWLNLIIESKFNIEKVNEPYANKAILKKCPHSEHTKNVPDIIIIRCRKN